MLAETTTVVWTWPQTVSIVACFFAGALMYWVYA